MESGLVASGQLDNLLVGPFSEAETSAILELIHKTIDVPFRKSAATLSLKRQAAASRCMSMKLRAWGSLPNSESQVYIRKPIPEYC